MNYDVRYGFIDTKDVYNLCDLTRIPELFYKFHSVWWTDTMKKVRQRAHDYYYNRYDELTNHYSNLEKSILKDGIKNPIVLTYAHRPMFRNVQEIDPDIRETPLLMLEHLGGSRFLIAKKHNMQIPVLISDFIGDYKSFEKLIDVEEIKNKFYTEDSFKDITLQKNGLHMTTKNFIHMPDTYNFYEQSRKRTIVVQEILQKASEWYNEEIKSK